MAGLRHFGVFEAEAIFEENRGEETRITMDTYFAETSGEPRPAAEIERLVWIDSRYKKQNIKIAPILERFIVPKLIEMKLIR